jgi:AAHS family 4-hydroxybenzoate transporter-like MFS transporter
LSAGAFGVIFAAGLLGLTIGAFVLGPIADRLGRKIVILGSTCAFGILALLTAMADSMTQLLVYRLLTGIGLGGALPNLIALTNEYVPNRLKSTLVMLMYCGFPLGATIGGLLSVPLIEHLGWRSVFIFGGLAPLLLLPVLIFRLPESIRFLAMRPGAGKKVARIIAKIDRSASAEAFISSIRLEARPPASDARFPALALFAEGRGRTTFLLWSAFFLNLLVMYFLVNWLPSLLTRSGLALSYAIFSTALLNLGGVVGAIVLGRLLDKRDPYLILGCAYAASACFIALIALSG